MTVSHRPGLRRLEFWRFEMNPLSWCTWDCSRVVPLSSILFLFVVLCSVRSSTASAATDATVLLVVGAPGDAEYGSNFLRQADLLQQVCTQAEACTRIIGVTEPGATNDYDLLRQALSDAPKEGVEPLWLVLIGHGTFDGKEAWFNLRGPDVSASELQNWLKPFRRPLAVINTAACSGPFLNKLSATNRVVITATRSGSEQNFTRFGQYFAESLKAPQADIDQDGQISLLEAFLTASHRVNEFYKSKGRLVTEHALLDDNGDGLGTPADWFRGLRATRKAKDGAALDGLLAQQFRLVPSVSERNLTPEQVVQRDALESAVLLLREKKSQVPEEDYYRELEKLLLQLATFYSSNETLRASSAK